MKKESIYNFILTILTSIILFFQNKYFIQYMGIESLGIMKLFNQLLQYLNIVELGLGSASSFALYKPLIENDYKKVSIIISTIKEIYNKISLLLLGLGVLTTPFLSYFIEIDNFTEDIYFYWIFYVINTASSYLYIKYIILYTANQEFIYTRFIQSTSKIFYQLLQIIFIIKYASLLIFIALLFLDNLTQYIIFKIHYIKKYSYIYNTKERYKGLYKDIKNLFWHRIGGLVVFNTDLILISKFISLEVVGVYTNYQLIGYMILMLTGVIVNVIKPKIGIFINKNNQQNIYFLFRETNTYFFLSALMFSYINYITVNTFINLWLGEGLYFANLTVILICINIFINIFRGGLDIFKESYGFFDDIQSPIFEAIINLLCSVILGIKYGLNGIIMGTIISNILVIMIYKPILVFKRCFDKGVKEYIKIYGNYLILLIISLVSLNIATKSFIRTNINTWIEWIIYATTISVITGGVLFIVFLLNKEFRNMIKIYVLRRK